MRTDRDDNTTSDTTSDTTSEAGSVVAPVVAVREQGDRRDRAERVQALAVFRFQLISPAIDEWSVPAFLDTGLGCQLADVSVS